jgi:hypothetical protein
VCGFEGGNRSLGKYVSSFNSLVLDSLRGLILCGCSGSYIITELFLKSDEKLSIKFRISDVTR